MDDEIILPKGFTFGIEGDAQELGIEDYDVRVCADATLEDDFKAGDDTALVTLDRIDGDARVCARINQTALRQAMNQLPNAKTFWHVSLTGNRHSIMRKGLIPKMGPRAKACSENEPSVWLFPTKADAENAVGNWLGDELGEGKLVLLKVTLPPCFPIIDEGCGFERRSTIAIPPVCLSVESDPLIDD